MTTARQGRVGFALTLFMLHCNTAFLSVWHRLSVIGVGIADKVHLIWDSIGRPLAGFAGRHRSLVVRYPLVSGARKI